MQFGEYLRSLRLSRNLRQADLASLLEVSTVYICDVEKGRRSPLAPTYLKKLVSNLHLSHDETSRFYNLEGNTKNDIPSDIKEYLIGNPEAITAIRKIIYLDSPYNWNELFDRKQGSK